MSMRPHTDIFRCLQVKQFMIHILFLLINNTVNMIPSHLLYSQLSFQHCLAMIIHSFPLIPIGELDLSFSLAEKNWTQNWFTMKACSQNCFDSQSQILCTLSEGIWSQDDQLTLCPTTCFWGGMENSTFFTFSGLSLWHENSGTTYTL